MKFIKYVWNSRFMPPLGAIVLLVLALMCMFPSPVIWFISTVCRIIWPYLSFILFWGSIVSMMLSGIGGLANSFAFSLNRREKIESAALFLISGIALGGSLKFVLVFDGGVHLWPSDLGTIAINTIAGIAGFIVYHTLDYKAFLFDKYEGVAQVPPVTVAPVEDSPNTIKMQEIRARGRP